MGRKDIRQKRYCWRNRPPKAGQKEEVEMIGSIVCCWLRWRYDGNVYALKNPIGYHPTYSPKSRWWIALYKVRCVIWRIENCLFKKYGDDMRNAWLQDRSGSKISAGPKGKPFIGKLLTLLLIMICFLCVAFIIMCPIIMM